MATMTTAEKNTAIRNAVINALLNAPAGEWPEGTVEVKPGFKYAIPVEVAGEQRWGEVSLTAKNNQPTKTSDAYDPFAVAEANRIEAEQKAAEKAAKAAEKAKKAAEREAAKASK